MSLLLFIVGALAVVAGAVMVGFGIPVNAFTFGNTLIAAGVTAMVGGLIVVGLGAVVAQLQRVVDGLVVRPPLRTSRALEPLERPQGMRGAPAGARIPFPPKPKADVAREQRPFAAAQAPADMPAAPRHELPHDLPHDDHAEPFAAPTLHNPDEPPVAVEDFGELPLSLRPHSAAPPVSTPAASAEPPRWSAAPPLAVNGAGDDKRQETSQETVQESIHVTAFDTGWHATPAAPPPAREPQTAHFDAMWPAPEPRAARAAALTGTPPAPRHEFHPEPPPQRETVPDMHGEQETAEPSETAMPAETSEPDGPRAVAILKSGVVDGMGYTLYVDGSIEAELPQGTLRFSSINDLRSHLEKNA
jgi:hypothetical protein